MEISLIRHGKSQLTENATISCSEFKLWVEKYDLHGVFEETTYPSETVEKTVHANIVVTSDLKRAIKSAELVKPDVNMLADPLFRETELPTFSIKGLNVKLRPSIWQSF